MNNFATKNLASKGGTIVLVILFCSSSHRVCDPSQKSLPKKNWEEYRPLESDTEINQKANKSLWSLCQPTAGYKAPLKHAIKLYQKCNFFPLSADSSIV